jgi:hypothetical protein
LNNYSVIKDLVELANKLDSQRMYKEADLVDATIIKLANNNESKLYRFKGDPYSYRYYEFGITSKSIPPDTFIVESGPKVVTKLFGPDTQVHKELMRRIKEEPETIESMTARSESTVEEIPVPENNVEVSQPELNSEPAANSRPSEVDTTISTPIVGSNKALIYGHSQAAGIGRDLESALKSMGYKVTRIVKVGYNDSALISELSAIPEGPWDKVFLFAGGNSTQASAADINTLINHFGRERVTVILPPVNKDNPSRRDMIRKKNKDNKDGISVPAFWIEGGQQEFGEDGIHMKAGSPGSNSLVGTVISNISNNIA